MTVQDLELDQFVKSVSQDCLLLLDECTSNFCILDRLKNPTTRRLIEYCVAEIVVSIGPGGMLQDLRILSKRTDTSIDYYVLDEFRDFFDMTSENINPYVYTGPDDMDAHDRAQW